MKPIGGSFRSRKRRHFFALGCGLIAILSYQNCGPGFNTQSGGALSSSSLIPDPGQQGDGGDPPPPPAGNPPEANGALSLGSLIHDGPATPEQISLLIPILGTLDMESKASVFFKKSTDPTWLQAHPLHRMRPEFSASSSFLKEGFAGVITGLEPNTEYDVRVAVVMGSVTDIKNLKTRTRSLPSESAKPKTKTVTAGSTAAQIATLFSSLTPGDVLEFENGIYNLENLMINRSGTDVAPIVIRGLSRTGVVLKDPTGRVLYLTEANNLIIENMTLEGSGIDSGIASSSVGIGFWNGTVQKNITLRNLTIRGVDMGIISSGYTEGIMVYDCTLLGNNKWDQDFFASSGSGTPGGGDGVRDGEQNVFWNDDGVRIPGQGNVAFNNTLNGFGDALAVTSGVDSVGVHFYRNEISMTGDDAFEGDYAVRNISFYDNRIHNAMTFVSFDPLYGGPAFIFRNIAINIRRGPLKLNSTNTGFIFANNTIVTTDGANNSPWAWAQSNNGAIRAWSYRNNIMIRKNVKNMMALESSGQTPIDFTNNAWFPGGSVWWSSSGGSFSSLTAAFAALPATVPLFGTSVHRHDHDVIIESDPFQTEVALGSNYRSLVATKYVPRLKDNSVAKGKGLAIIGITDGFTGEAPDMGAVISGRPVPFFGDRK